MIKLFFSDSFEYYDNSDKKNMDLYEFGRQYAARGYILNEIITNKNVNDLIETMSELSRYQHSK